MAKTDAGKADAGAKGSKKKKQSQDEGWFSPRLLALVVVILAGAAVYFSPPDGPSDATAGTARAPDQEEEIKFSIEEAYHKFEQSVKELQTLNEAIDAALETQELEVSQEYISLVRAYAGDGEKILEELSQTKDEPKLRKMLVRALKRKAQWDKKMEEASRESDKKYEEAAGDFIVDVTEAEFAAVTQENRRVLVYFYAPWCGHCKSFSSQWGLASKAMHGSDMLKLVRVDGDNAADLLEKHGVEAFPTIMLFSRGDVAARYDGDATAQAMLKWLQEQIEQSYSVVGEEELKIIFEHLPTEKKKIHVAVLRTTDPEDVLVYQDVALFFPGKVLFLHVEEEGKQELGMWRGNGDKVGTRQGALQVKALRDWITVRMGEQELDDLD